MATTSQVDSLFQEVASRVSAAAEFSLSLQERLSANIVAANTLAKTQTMPGAYFFETSFKVEEGIKTSGIQSVELKSYLAEGYILVNHTPGLVECKVSTVKSPRVLYEQVFKFFGTQATAPDAISVADHMTGLLVKSDE